MTFVRDLVHDLATEPSRPRLTWYGAGGERVELSGRVLVNTVVKATNLLVEEAEAGPGSRIALDLPVHWRTAVWALAAWTAGAQVCLSGAAASPAAAGDDIANWDAFVTDRPARFADAGARSPGVVVAVALPALAMRFPGELPASAVDGAADLMTYPDALGWLPPLDGDQPALSGLDRKVSVTHHDLLTWARTAAAAEAWLASPRVLAVGADVVDLLVTGLTAWATDGSLVVVADPAADLVRIASQERVTTSA